jgi:hypothetical protein
MSKRAVGPALAVVAALFAASIARAEDPPGGGKPAAGKPEDPKKDEAKKDEAKKETLRIERAKKLVAEIEQAIARVKAAQPIDQEMLQRLFTMLDEAKALVRPARPEELTAEEKKAVVDEAQKSAPPEEPKKGGEMNDWQARAMARAFEGAELSQDEEKKATPIIGEWWKENMASMGDSKRQSDLKRKRDDDLEKALGKKKAQKVINNLNAMGPGRK